MWYERSFRRHLCDMHIDDWDDSFLSKFSADDYFEHLKKANISAAMLYYQSHVGLCYYPTKTARMHKAFIGREDEMRRLTDMCREAGIAVIGYYSLNYNVWAHDNHPEWRMITADGVSKREGKRSGGAVSFEKAEGGRYGICCPNNEDYLNFVYDQIDEMLEYFTPDGLFFDMLYWPHACYCESCQKKWKEETGLDSLPRTNSFDDPLWREFCRVRNRWMGEYAQKVTDYIKARAPHLSVEHNISAAAKEGYLGTGTEVNRAGDYCGGDLAGGLLEESVVCKLYREISMNQPFEYMFPKCEPSLHLHTLVKTDEHIESAVFLAAAHHGATMVIDAIDPVGTMNPRSSESIGRAFSKLIPYEKYFVGESVADIGVVYGLDSKGKGRFGNSCNNHSAVVGFIKNMIEGGIAVDVISRSRDLSRYKMVFAPCLWECEEELVSALLKYADNGGVLFVSGAGNDDFIEEVTGGKIVGMTESQPCYFAPEADFKNLFEGFDRDYPLPINARVPMLSFDGDIKVLARLTMPYTPPTGKVFASIHSNPPGIPLDTPAVVERPYGKGQIIYSAAPIEHEEYIVYQRIIRNFIDRYVGLDALTVRTDSPAEVETVTHRHGDDIYISNALLLDPKKPPHMPSFTVNVRTETQPRSVKLLPDEKEVDFTYDGEYVSFKTYETKIFDMYKIEL